MPSFRISFSNGKRSKRVAIAAAGTLAAVSAVSVAAVALSSGSASAGSAADSSLLTRNGQQAAQANGMPSAQDMAQFVQMRNELAAAQTATAKAAAAKAAAIQAAAAKAAAAKAAAAKAAAAKAAAQQKARQAAPSGSPQQLAQQLLGQFGWPASQFSCLQPLWAHESGWSVSASNPSSGAYGIPQALPGSRMASAGQDWQTSAATQIRWGLQYIQGTYGSPCAAWSHEESAGWY